MHGSDRYTGIFEYHSSKRQLINCIIIIIIIIMQYIIIASSLHHCCLIQHTLKGFSTNTNIVIPLATELYQDNCLQSSSNDVALLPDPVINFVR